MANRPIIGLTGGIASGKSTVARVLEQEGVGIVDADQIAREVVAPGTDGLRAVVDAFGEAVLAQDGSLDRERLGAIVFADPQARLRLQAITHPRIGRLSAERLAALQASSVPYVVYEAALLVEVGGHKGLGALIVVAADEAQQVRRVMERDALSEEAARKRIAAQLPLARKVEVADYVLRNDGSLRELEAATLDLHKELINRFGVPQEGR
jgi:dephospho-CoA kinase